MTRAPVPAAALAALLAACTSGEVSSTAALTEPIRVESGQFIAGPLPGFPPPAVDADVDAAAPASPQVADIDIPNTAIEQGEEGVMISGHTTAGAQTVGLRFADLGTGYWVVPVGGPDPTDQDLPSYQLEADFARGVPPGLHDLLFSAIAADGSSGTEAPLSLCFDTPVPDNLNVCVPSRRPPAAVLSLAWDTAVDLDLVVQDPSGATVGGNASTAASGLDGGAAPGAPAGAADGVIDHDSNANCVIDDIDQEDIVWQSRPQGGTYDVWVDLFSACRQASVSFTVSLWLAEDQPDGTQRLVEQKPPLAAGVLTALQANGGSGPGLFVGSFDIE